MGAAATGAALRGPRATFEAMPEADARGPVDDGATPEGEAVVDHGVAQTPADQECRKVGALAP
eukprot:634783-Pyramimonas_sp.AAC.1